MVLRSVCAPWMSFVVWLLMGVKFAGVVGDGVAVVVRSNVVRFVVAHGREEYQTGRGIPISTADSGGWWCCSAPDVLARLPAQIKREKKGKKGKEIKKVRAYRCPNLDN